MTWFGPVSVLGECPRWDDATQVLSWVDIDGGTLHRAVLGDDGWQVTTAAVGVPLAGAVAAEGAPGHYVVALGGDVADWSDAGGLGESVPVLPPDQAGAIRLNETVTDPDGRIWVGSMAYDWTPGAGAFFTVGPGGAVRRVLSGFTITNGVGWSPDGTEMYTTETRPGCITAWRVGPGGALRDPRVVLTADGTDGAPDGLAVDVDGNLWSAFAGGGHVTCVSQGGAVLRRVEVGGPLVTSCCFAGPGRDRLVVTTGTKRLDAPALARFPESGRARDLGEVGTTGLPQPPTTRLT